jgi:predicted metalloprotease with PDZ domain
MNVTKLELAIAHRAALLVGLASLSVAASGVIPARAGDVQNTPPPQAAAPAPAAPPAPAAAPASHDADTDLDAQLEAARRQLELDVREVARLSTQLSGSVIDSVMPYVTPHAIIGVQLERDSAGGARVREVSPGGPAAEAGIRPGDVLLAVNGTELKGGEPARQVVRIMRDVKPESKVHLRVLRDGTAHEYVVTARAGPTLVGNLNLADLPGLPDVRDALMPRRQLMDMELATLTPRLGSYFGTDKGVLVVRAPADGALKLEDGDVILAIDGREPTSGSHATRILSSYQPGEKIALRILRQHKTLEVQATLPERADHARPDRTSDASQLDRRARRLDEAALHLDRYLQALEIDTGDIGGQ